MATISLEFAMLAFKFFFLHMGLNVCMELGFRETLVRAQRTRKVSPSVGCMPELHVGSQAIFPTGSVFAALKGAKVRLT